MEILKLGEIPKTGLPLYELQQLFDIKGTYKNIKISYITLLPGKRVPECGTGSHAEDEYSFFLEGEVYTESGDFKGICGEGDATFIPRGEEHWCINKSDKPCHLICVMTE